MTHMPSPPALAGVAPTEGRAPDGVLRETIFGSRVLVVDDQKLIRDLIGAYLAAGGYHNLSFAEDGDEALDKIEAENPDLVILDLQMPRLGGLDVCAAVRATPERSDLPILVQTAADSPADRARIFSVGATDMVGKPINDAELLARVGIHLQNRHMLQQLSVYRTSMERELEAARRMQHDMMPRDDAVLELESRYPLRIRSLFQTCDALGGDIWNLWPIDDTRLCFAVVDFTGHGVVASLNTFRFQSLTRMFGRDIAETGLQNCVERLNNELCDMLPVGQFATAIVGYVDFGSDVLRYVAAGGPKPFVRSPSAPDSGFLASEGRPLGMIQDSQYPERTVRFPAGSSVFLYSDALTETPSMADPVCDEDAIREILDGPESGAGETRFDALTGDFFSRIPGPLNDDLTLLELSRIACGETG